MKFLLRIKYPLAAAILAAGLAACDVHEFPSEPAPPVPVSELLLRFNDGDMPLLSTVEYDSPKTRASHTPDARFIIHVYPDEDASGTRGPSRSPKEVTVFTDAAEHATDNRIVPLQLSPGNYRILIWSDFVDADTQDDKYYSTDDLSEITLLSANGDNSRYQHQGNNPWREAYRGERRMRVSADGSLSHLDGTPTESGRTLVEMNRPMAKFSFITTDLADFIARRSSSGPSDAPAYAPRPNPADYRVVLRYTSYMPSAYNAHTDKPIDSRLGAYFDGSIDRIDDSNAKLGSDYVLVNGSSTTVQVALDVYSRADQSLIASTSPIEVPLKRGHLTLVRGRFLTSKSGTEMGIDPGFFDDINIEIK